MVWRSLLPWLLLLLPVAAILVLIVGTVEAWPWMKKFKNTNEDQTET
jgi:hypothetical protein